MTARPRRPHLLGIDDGPFEKGTSRDVPIVGVLMEGADLVESVAVTRFPVDGADVTTFLGNWIVRLRATPGLHAIVLGGITIAGLGLVDIAELARQIGRPVLAISRRDPARHRVADALRAAGLLDRLLILERAPQAFAMSHGVFVACAGIADEEARVLVGASTAKADVPEPLRLAHLIARAIGTGESHGRV